MFHLHPSLHFVAVSFSVEINDKFNKCWVQTSKRMRLKEPLKTNRTPSSYRKKRRMNGTLFRHVFLCEYRDLREFAAIFFCRRLFFLRTFTKLNKKTMKKFKYENTISSYSHMFFSPFDALHTHTWWRQSKGCVYICLWSDTCYHR